MSFIGTFFPFFSTLPLIPFFPFAYTQPLFCISRDAPPETTPSIPAVLSSQILWILARRGGVWILTGSQDKRPRDSNEISTAAKVCLIRECRRRAPRDCQLCRFNFEGREGEGATFQPFTRGTLVKKSCSRCRYFL